MSSEAAALLDRLRQADIRLSAIGDRLRYDAPRAALTPELRAAIARHKQDLLRLLSGDGDAIPMIDRGVRIELSPAQLRLWFLQQVAPSTPLYNIAAAVRFEGPLDRPALLRALREVVRRHESLRTTFPLDGNLPVQKVVSDRDVYLPDTDLSVLDRHHRERLLRLLMSEEASARFDLVNGPLLRARLFRLGEEDVVFQLTTHHLVADGWSMGILARELFALYAAYALDRPSPLADLPLQYADYSEWLRRRIERQAFDADLEYWTARLDTLPPALDLPFDHVRPESPSFRGSTSTLDLPPDLATQLEQLGGAHGCTLFVTLLAAFQWLLVGWSSQDEIVVATAVSNRPRRELEDVIGCFANTLLLRGSAGGDPTFVGMLLRTRQVVADALDHQDLPFASLVKALQPQREAGMNPFFRVMFALESGGATQWDLPNGVRARSLEVNCGTSKFDFGLYMLRTRDGLRAFVEYSRELFEEETVRRMFAQFEHVLRAVAERPALRLSSISFGPAEERCDAIGSGDPVSGALFHERIFAQPAAALALSGGGVHMTFGELDRAAKRFATTLLRAGVGPESRVGISLRKSPEAVIAILGTLQAGGAFVPLDPHWPRERLELVAADAGLKVVVSGDELAIAGVARIAPNDAPSAADVIHLPRVLPDNLAYVMYTSGSTGRPKGVMVTHRSLIHLCRALDGSVYSGADGRSMRIGVNGPFTFDTSIKQLVQLASGHSLHLLTESERGFDPARVLEELAREAVDVVDFTPSHLGPLMDAGLADGRPAPSMILSGGEVVPPGLWQRMAEAKHIRFFNVYGPTECTVDATFAPIDAAAPPNIGVAMPGVRVYLLDAQLRPVPDGISGELFIGGGGVARGYQGGPDRTAESFLPDPFAGEAGAVMYRTGDRARRRAGGALEFLGRTDDQVKVRGTRVELGEIECELRAHPSVRDVFVASNANRLVAYVTPHARNASSVEGRPRYPLPNGLAIAHLNRGETDFLYRDIFERRAYFRHGIRPRSGDCIFDVGSNIGVFALACLDETNDLDIHCFEPNPIACQLLRHNMNLYAPGAHIEECAVGGESGTATLTSYPKLSILSGFHANRDEEQSLVRSFVQRQRGDAIDSRKLDDLTASRLESVDTIVRVRTLAEIIDERRIDRIDLLKINVEKSERSVLRGMRDGDFARVRSVVLEVHDRDDRLAGVVDLLRKHGLVPAVEHDWSVGDSEKIFYVYGTRDEISSPASHPMSGGRKLADTAVVLTLAELQQFVRRRLPEAMVPRIVIVDRMPLNANGKVDRAALERLDAEAAESRRVTPPRGDVEQRIASTWKELIGRANIGRDDNFFEAGGDSLLAIELHARLGPLSARVGLLDLFEYPTIALLAAHIEQTTPASSWTQVAPREEQPAGDAIAIIGMAGRFPGAADVEALLWNLRNGVESIRPFDDEELRDAGVDPRVRDEQGYVAAGAPVDGEDLFDAAFFGFTPREAELMDPQQRIFLETVSNALEDAAIDPERHGGKIGLFAGTGISTYLLNNLWPDRDLVRAAGPHQLAIANDKDHLATQAAYRFNLRGPSVAIQTTCSTSLVAVHVACASLRAGECDVALAGGCSVRVPQRAGYPHEPGGIASPDGHCRVFDAAAGGTVLGNGAGVVVLRRLDEALADGDRIVAVIRGSAVNNDGGVKAGYTAPSVVGQAGVIAEALAVAGVTPDSIGYVEAHGTGTRLGDPIEIAALTRVFGQGPPRCAIGSVKSNVGHLDAAAGVTGLIKTALMLRERLLVPSLHFVDPNPAVEWDRAPFYVNTETRPWIATEGMPLRAGVSSFGIGGTNAHVVLEEAPAYDPSETDDGPQVLIVSARSAAALDEATDRLCDALDDRVPLADIAWTLQHGRRAFAHRRAVVASNAAEAIERLRRAAGSVVEGSPPPVDREPSCEGAARLWTLGADIDWRALHGGKRRRSVALPTYPFQRQRYWIDPPDQREARIQPAVAPAPNIEHRLVAIWEEMFGLAPIGIDDDFFTIGGHSLLATQIVARIGRELAVVLPLEEIFSVTTIRELARIVERGGNGAVVGGIERHDDDAVPDWLGAAAEDELTQFSGEFAEGDET